MSGMATYTPGMEISGGSLGHGLTVAIGMALGLRHQGNPARVYNLLSDGELDEGSTWEAAMQIAHHGLGQRHRHRRRQRPAGRRPDRHGVLRTEPVTDKWEAFGWHAHARGRQRHRRPRRRLRRSPRAHRLTRGDHLRHPHRTAGCRCWRPARRRTSCASAPTNGRPPATSSPRATPPQVHAAATDTEGLRPMTTTSAAPQKKRLTTSAMIASFADPGQKTASAPFGHALAKLAAGAPGDRRALRGPGQVHRHAHLPRRPPGAVLPDGHGRAGHVRRRGRPRRGRSGALRVDLLGLRDPPRLRLPLPRHRRTQPERQHRRRTARADHRLRAQPPGHRGPGDPARLPEPDHRRPLRLRRHRTSRPAARRPRRARPTCGCSAARSPPCSTSTATASSSARPPSCAPAATSSSSPPA